MTGEKKRQRRLAMAEAIKNGKSIAAVCAKFKMSYASVVSACREADIKPPTEHARSPVSAFQILKAVLDGKTPLAAAEKFGVSNQRVYAVISAARKAGFSIISDEQLGEKTRQLMRKQIDRMAKFKQE